MLKQSNGIKSPLLSIWSRYNCLDIAPLRGVGTFISTSVANKIKPIKMPTNIPLNINDGYFHFIFNANFPIIKHTCGNFIDFLPHPYAYFKTVNLDINNQKFLETVSNIPKEEMKISINMIFFDLDDVVDRTLPDTSNPGVIPGLLQTKIAHLHHDSYSPLNEFKFKLKNEISKKIIRFLVFIKLSSAANFDCFLIEIRNADLDEKYEQKSLDQSYETDLSKALALSKMGSENDEQLKKALALSELDSKNDEQLKKALALSKLDGKNGKSWDCTVCTFTNTSGDICQICQNPKIKSSSSSSSSKSSSSSSSLKPSNLSNMFPVSSTNKSTVGKSCPECTFENAEKKDNCEMCGKDLKLAFGGKGLKKKSKKKSHKKSGGKTSKKKSHKKSGEKMSKKKSHKKSGGKTSKKKSHKKK